MHFQWYLYPVGSAPGITFHLANRKAEGKVLFTIWNLQTTPPSTFLLKSPAQYNPIFASRWHFSLWEIFKVLQFLVSFGALGTTLKVNACLIILVRSTSYMRKYKSFRVSCQLKTQYLMANLNGLKLQDHIFSHGRVARYLFPWTEWALSENIWTYLNNEEFVQFL